MRYCPRCGHACGDQDALCSRCGYILGTQPTQRPPVYPPYPPMRRSGVAAASLVLGILSVLWMFRLFGFLTAPVAVILGIRALRQIRRSGGTLRGRGMAVAGLVTGGIVLVIGAALLLMLLINGGVTFRHGDFSGGTEPFPLPGGQGIPT